MAWDLLTLLSISDIFSPSTSTNLERTFFGELSRVPTRPKADRGVAGTALVRGGFRAGLPPLQGRLPYVLQLSGKCAAYVCSVDQGLQHVLHLYQ